MVKRGGGAFAIEVREIEARKKKMLIVHMHVNVQDAMGANIVNSMCEEVAPLIEKITGGKVFLRILSNLTDKSIVKAGCKFRLTYCRPQDIQLRDAIILANDFALADTFTGQQPIIKEL